MEKIKGNALKILYLIATIVFVVPSISYLINNRTVFDFKQWFKYFLDDSDRGIQTITYIIILLIITILYVLIIKNRKKLFKNIKGVLVYTGVIGFIYLFTIPFMCSDVFYYMGVGRVDAQYNQNPYYTTIKEYVDENKDKNPEIKKDTVLLQGYINDWGDSTVVYGPVWQLICKGVSILSFGDVNIGLLMFKILNLVIHIFNCYLIYKLTGKKIFAIIYGLNPFVLIEAIMAVHNDIFVVMFTLLSLYFMLKKKKIGISMGFLALATAIKYFSVILLPFMLVYYFRKEKTIFNRFAKCMQYGLIFIGIVILPYLFYIRDLNVLSGIITQQTKIAKSIYIPIMQFFENVDIDQLSGLLLKAFVIIYFFSCLRILFKKELTFRYVMQKYNIFLLVFLFVLITQFQIWYLMWLIPVFMWQNANNLKLMVGIWLISEFANTVFLANGEGYTNGTPFVIVMITLILGLAVFIEKQSIKRKIICFKKKLKEE